VIAQVAELYLRRAETGVGEEARASNEVRGAEFDGLAGVRPSGIVEMKVEHYFLRWVAQAHVHGLVEDVQGAAQHLQRFAEVPAAEGRIDEQPVVARVGFLRRQLQAEASIFRRLGREIEECHMLLEWYAGGGLIQQMGLNPGLLKQLRRREAASFQLLG